jgi:hypothetical protein
MLRTCFGVILGSNLPWFSSLPSGKFKLDHDHFLPYSFQFIIQVFSLVVRYIASVSESTNPEQHSFNMYLHDTQCDTVTCNFRVLIHVPWRWRQIIPPKYRYPTTKLHSCHILQVGNLTSLSKLQSLYCVLYWQARFPSAPKVKALYFSET